MIIQHILFGDCSPSGKLPLTFYESSDDLPDITDYSMKNRTYRYYKDEPLYPFGFGLSYTSFAYSDFKVLSNDDEFIKVSVDVKTKNLSGTATLQLIRTDIDEDSEDYDSSKNPTTKYPKKNC